jgi:hypothetical protein
MTPKKIARAPHWGNKPQNDLRTLSRPKIIIYNKLKKENLGRGALASKRAPQPTN